VSHHVNVHSCYIPCAATCCRTLLLLLLLLPPSALLLLLLLRQPLLLLCPEAIKAAAAIHLEVQVCLCVAPAENAAAAEEAIGVQSNR
jgi:hypothetical protein